MKKIILTIFASLFLVAAPSVYAAEQMFGKDIVTVAKDEVIDDNFYATGEIIEIQGTINGDAYLFGGQILINGDIKGDLISAGGTINLSGTIGQDARLAGGQIIVNSKIGKNLSAAGGNIDITSNSIINGGAQLAGGTITISAPIAQELMLGSGSATLNNTVSKDINAGVGTLRLTDNAKVGGALIYWSDQEASIANSGNVTGQTTWHKPEQSLNKPTDQQIKHFFTGVDIFSKLTSIIATLIFGFLMLKLYPNYSARAADIVTQKTLRAFIYGFLGIIIFPFSIILIIITLVGIPFAVLLTPIVIFYIYLARIFSMLAIGKLLVAKAGLKRNTQTIHFLIGLVSYFVLSAIPLVGGVFKLVVILISFGAALMNDKETHALSSKAKIS